MLLSSQRDNQFIAYYTLPSFRRCVLFLSATSGPHSIAVAVTAKNIPPECFLDAATVQQEIIYPEWDFISEITAFTKVGAVFYWYPLVK